MRKVMPLSEFEVELLDAREVVGPHQRKPSDPLVLLDGSVGCDTCGFRLSLADGGPVILAEYYTKALHYVMVVTVFTIIQMVLVSYQLDATSTPSVREFALHLLRLQLTCTLDSIKGVNGDGWHAGGH